jgi:hypothetical protein
MRWLDEGRALARRRGGACLARDASASATTAMPSPIGAMQEALRADCFSRRLTASLQVFI